MYEWPNFRLFTSIGSQANSADISAKCLRAHYFRSIKKSHKHLTWWCISAIEKSSIAKVTLVRGIWLGPEAMRGVVWKYFLVILLLLIAIDRTGYVYIIFKLDVAHHIYWHNLYNMFYYFLDLLLSLIIIMHLIEFIRNIFKFWLFTVLGPHSCTRNFCGHHFFGSKCSFILI